MNPSFRSFNVIFSGTLLSCLNWKSGKRSSAKITERTHEERKHARDVKEFMRISGMTHVRTSPYYPQSNVSVRVSMTIRSLAKHFSMSGEVVGASDLAGDTVFHGFVWNQRTGMQDIPPVRGDTYSVALVINDGGVVTGVSIDSTFTNLHAFVVVDGVSTDPNTLISADSPLQL